MHRLLLLASAAVVLAAGCTTSEAGNPTTSRSSPESSSSTSSESSSPTVEIPPRPKALKLDSVEPCPLLTDAQRATLGVGRTRATTNQSEIYKGAKQCVLDVDSSGVFYAYSIDLVTTEGIAPWLSGKRNVEAELLSIDGYPAVQHLVKGAGGSKNSNECFINVDVADGQQLVLGMALTSRNKFTQDQICKMTEEAAGMALTTLQTLV